MDFLKQRIHTNKSENFAGFIIVIGGGKNKITKVYENKIHKSHKKQGVGLCSIDKNDRLRKKQVDFRQFGGYIELTATKGCENFLVKFGNVTKKRENLLRGPRETGEKKGEQNK